MEKHQLTINASINAPLAKVWAALTQPEQIKQYMFGTQVVTDWVPSHPIRFHGEWQGKPYEEKGLIVDVIDQQKIAYSYWSVFFGLLDLPENHQTVTYTIESQGENTLLTVSQTNIFSQQMKDHSEKNWQAIVAGLKSLIESPV